MDDLEKLYKMKDLQKYLGGVGRSTIYGFIKRGAIKPIYLSPRQMRFEHSEVVRLIEGKKSDSYRIKIYDRMKEDEDRFEI